MKKTALFVILALVIAAPVFAQGPFNDVPTDHWAYDAVNQLQKDGIVIGYPDGTYGGKRAMTRYEFAVAIARVMEAVAPPSATDLSNYATKSYVDNAIKGISKAEAQDLSKFATKADVDALRKLIDEFRDEIAALGVDVDALKRDVCALAARVDALEIEQRRVRFTGSANVFAISTDHRSGVNAHDLDERVVVGNDTLGRNISYVQDFDLNLVGRVSDSTTAMATINYGNYLNYLVAVDDYVDGRRPSQGGQVQQFTTGGTSLSHSFVDAFFPYYLYIDSALGKGAITVGRFPMQFTPYTFKKIDVDSYTSILKTDSGDYPVDGIKLGYALGGVDLVLYAAKHNENDYLVNGLTAQPRAGLFNLQSAGLAFGTFNDLGGNSVGGLSTLISQSAGARAQFGIPWGGNVGLTYYQAWSQDAFETTVPVAGPTAGQLYDQARVFGGDITIPFGCNFGLSGSWTQSDALAADKAGVTVGDITDDNTAWDAKITAGFGKLGFGAGYKNIERNFAAAGSWDKIGRWTNPTNIQGPYVDFNYPISSKIKLVLNGEWLTAIDTITKTVTPAVGPAVTRTLIAEDDQIIKGEAGLQWGFSAANSVALGVQWIQYNPDGDLDDGTEAYYTIGWAHQFNPNAGLKVAYQFFNWDGGANDIAYGPSYRAGLGVVQFGVNF